MLTHRTHNTSLQEACRHTPQVLEEGGFLDDLQIMRVALPA
jgi:hypothetical protein